MEENVEILKKILFFMKIFEADFFLGRNIFQADYFQTDYYLRRLFLGLLHIIYAQFFIRPIIF